jgi:hypothetical protein
MLEKIKNIIKHARESDAQTTHWLKRKITPETVECELDTDFLTKFLPIMQEGDAVWYFDNELWDVTAGRSGYCIVRDGAVIHSEIWAMS